MKDGEDLDYYKVLGVTEQFNVHEINQVYRRKCLECHPDKHGNDHEAMIKFHKLQEAHAVLGDEQRRAMYDAWRVSGIDVPFQVWETRGGMVHWRVEREREQIERETGAYDDDNEGKDEKIRNDFRNYKI